MTAKNSNCHNSGRRKPLNNSTRRTGEIPAEEQNNQDKLFKQVYRMLLDEYMKDKLYKKD